MADNLLLNVTLKFNKDTGALEIANQKVKEFEKSAGAAGNKVSDLSSFAKGLVPAFTAVAAISFLKGAIEESNKMDGALRRLKFQVEATGGSWRDSKQGIREWADAIQKTTRFSDDQAVQSLEELTRMTGDLSQAQLLGKLAMDISSSTGKDLVATQEKLGLVYNGNARGLLALKREFGDQLKNVKNSQEAIDALSKIYKNASENESSFTKRTEQLKNKFQDLEERIGGNLKTSLVFVADQLDRIFKDPKDKTKKEITDTAGAVTDFIDKLKEAKKIKHELDTTEPKNESQAQEREVKQRRLNTLLKENVGITNRMLTDEKFYLQTINEELEKKIKAKQDEKKAVKEVITVKPSDKAITAELKAKADALKAELELDKENLGLQMQIIDAEMAYRKAAKAEELRISTLTGNEKAAALKQQSDYQKKLEISTQNEKAKAVIASASKIIDIEGNTNKVIDTLATGSAEQKKFLIADILEAEALANSKRLAMQAIIYAVELKFAQAAAAAAGAIALGVVAGQIHSATEAEKEKDKIAKEAEEKRKADAEAAAKEREAAEKKHLEATGDLAAKELDTELDREGATNAEKLAALEAYNQKELAILKEKKNKKLLTDQEYADQLALLEADIKNKKQNITQAVSAAVNASGTAGDSVTASETIVRIELGGVTINIDTVNTTEADLNKLMADIGNQVQAKTLEGIQMAMKVYNAGKEREGLSI